MNVNLSQMNLCKYNQSQNKTKKKRKKKKKKLTVSRKASRCLSQKHAGHFADNLKSCLNANPNIFCADHPVGIIDHMFAGNDKEKHLKLCPQINSKWCHFYTGKHHVTTMARNSYLDRTDDKHNISYQEVRQLTANKFDESLCNALRGLNRTNGNEVCHCLKSVSIVL